MKKEEEEDFAAFAANVFSIRVSRKQYKLER